MSDEIYLVAIWKKTGNERERVRVGKTKKKSHLKMLKMWTETQARKMSIKERKGGGEKRERDEGRVQNTQQGES